MNYINKLQLQNFQSHKNTSIELAPPGQLTVIVGPSDNGKTAIIRALKLLAYNSPQGTDYIRIGESGTNVTAITSGGTKVARQRTRGGVNRYILVSQDGKEQKYEGFGNTVPLEAQQTLGISPIQIGDMDFNLNLSEQLDGPFLGNSVPVTAKAKVLGKLSGVEEVDHANKTLGTDLYRKEREKEGLQNEIKTTAKEIEGYKHLDELGPLIKTIEKFVIALRCKVEKKEKLDELKIRLSGLTAAIEQEKAKVEVLQFAENAELTLVKAEVNYSKYEKLAKLRSVLQDIKQSLEQAQVLLTEALNVDKAITILNKAETTQAKLRQSQQTFQRVQNLQNSLTETKEEKEQAGKTLRGMAELLNAEKLYKNLAEKAKKKVELIELQKDYVVTKEEKEQAKIALKETAELLNAEKLQNVLAEKAEKRGRLIALRSAVEKIKNENFHAKDTVIIAKSAVATNAENLKKALLKARRCPTCGTVLSPEKIEEVV